MSHELRTPLNSILVLGEQLADNVDKNLTSSQVEFARTIHGAGTDLLNLINDILDMEKIGSGTVTVQCESLSFADLDDAVQRSFRHETESGDLAFTIDFTAALPEVMTTDPKRLLQVLKNLLSNAFKFTDRGGVALRVDVARNGWTPGQAVLDNAPIVISFAVNDTGIGIPLDKQRIGSSRSSRPTPARRASTAAQALVSRSAASSHSCSAARYACRAFRGGQHVHALPAAHVCRRGRAA